MSFVVLVNSKYMPLMNGEDHSSWLMAEPTVAPLNIDRVEHWRRFDNSVNAVSFGFVATAILISMFLVMAIFERFLRPRSSMPSGPNSASDLEAQMMFNGKLNYPSPKVRSLSLSLFLIENRNYLFLFLLSASDGSCCKHRNFAFFFPISLSILSADAMSTLANMIVTVHILSLCVSL